MASGPSGTSATSTCPARSAGHSVSAAGVDPHGAAAPGQASSTGTTMVPGGSGVGAEAAEGTSAAAAAGGCSGLTPAPTGVAGGGARAVGGSTGDVTGLLAGAGAGVPAGTVGAPVGLPDVAAGGDGIGSVCADTGSVSAVSGTVGRMLTAGVAVTFAAGSCSAGPDAAPTGTTAPGVRDARRSVAEPGRAGSGAGETAVTSSDLGRSPPTWARTRAATVPPTRMTASYCPFGSGSSRPKA